MPLLVHGVRILKGNHDEHAAVAVSYFLLAWYRNEPRVKRATLDLPLAPEQTSGRF